MNGIVRLSRPGDEPALMTLWKRVFGDSEEYIAGFLAHMYAPGDAIVYDIDGAPSSCAYLLDLGETAFPGESPKKCTVLYAFATLPEYRGHGYGRLVTEKLLEISRDSFQTVCPAEPSLFGYYREKYGYGEYFYTAEKEYSGSDLVPLPGSSPRRLSPGEYGALREELLDGRAHIRYNEKTLAYQHFLCENAGGAMTALELGGRRCCAAFEVWEGRAVIKELLCPPALESQALSAIHAAVGAKTYLVRRPAEKGEKSRPFAMAMNGSGLSDILPWFCFAFD